MPIGLAREAHDRVERDGEEVVVEGVPVGDLEGCHEGSHQHQEDGAGADDRANHQHRLVADVGQGDVVVDLDHALCRKKCDMLGRSNTGCLNNTALSVFLYYNTNFVIIEILSNKLFKKSYIPKKKKETRKVYCMCDLNQA